MRRYSVRRTAGLATLLLAAASQAHAAAEPDYTCDGQAATIVGTDEHDRLVGTSGDDVIVGLGSTDFIYGGRGDDVICGGPGEFNWLFGEEGDDRLFITGPGRVDGGRGNDVIDTSKAKSGRPDLTFSDAVRRVRVDLVAGTVRGQGDDTLLGVPAVIGTPFADKIFGDADRNFLDGGGGGDDVIVGGPGPDRLGGQAGVDTLKGGGGDDELFGGRDDDLLRGGPGRDILADPFGDDELYGGSGVDKLRGSYGEDFGDGGANKDRCVAIEVRISCERWRPAPSDHQRE